MTTGDMCCRARRSAKADGGQGGDGQSARAQNSGKRTHAIVCEERFSQEFGLVFEVARFLACVQSVM
eukprot:6210503-Pleurochrysis_carterae.AAC.1